jgi:hypothetical protein
MESQNTIRDDANVPTQRPDAISGLHSQTIERVREAVNAMVEILSKRQRMIHH